MLNKMLHIDGTAKDVEKDVWVVQKAVKDIIFCSDV